MQREGCFESTAMELGLRPSHSCSSRLDSNMPRIVGSFLQRRHCRACGETAVLQRSSRLRGATESLRLAKRSDPVLRPFRQTFVLRTVYRFLGSRLREAAGKSSGVRNLRSCTRNSGAAAQQAVPGHSGTRRVSSGGDRDRTRVVIGSKSARPSVF